MENDITDLIEKNNNIAITINDIGYNGEGIAKVKGMTIFVPFAYIGEKIKARVLHKKHNIAYAKVLDVLTPADERVRPECNVFTECGGCQIQHIKYSYQLRFKRSVVRAAFKKIAKLDLKVPICTKSGAIYGYRNKLQLPVGIIDGQNVVGFYKNNSHEIVPTNSCPLHPEWNEVIIKSLLEFMNTNKLKGYDEKTHTGDIRHLVVRQIQKKIMITVVVNGRSFEKKAELVETFAKKYPNSSIYLNYNDVDTNVVTSGNYELLYGEKLLYADFQTIRYCVHPATFVQVNDSVKDKIYSKILTLCGRNSNDIIIDAYSGSGVLSAILTRTGSTVYGIEVVKEATKNANEIALLNDLQTKLYNINGTCENELPRLIKSLDRNKKITLVLDPPRKGCDVELLKVIKENRIDKIVYLSCNPSTLARDVGILTNILGEDGSPKPEKKFVESFTDDYDELDNENDDTQSKVVKNEDILADSDYNIVYIHAYDMFPQTKHIETLVCLERKQSRT